MVVVPGTGFVPATKRVTVSAPTPVAAIAGERVGHRYVGESARRNVMLCKNAIESEGMRFMTRLCGLPPEVTARLYPGTFVTFAGRGTWMGLCVDDVVAPRRP